MLLLPFSANDLAATRFAAAPAPMIELGIAVAMLQRRDEMFEQWRREARRRLLPLAGPLFELIPDTAAGPLFLDPVTQDFDEGLDAVLSTPPQVAAAELRRVCSPIASPNQWLRGLEAGDRDAWTSLRQAIRAGQESLLATHWPRICACYRAEVDLRARQWARTGLRTLLAALHPAMRWNGDVLAIPAVTQLRVDLQGRGVILLPSLFWRRRPTVARRPDGTVVIVYAAATPLPLSGASAGTSGPGGTIAALIGANRAAVLASAAQPCTTTELARTVCISLAAASQHAAVLRNAGLLTTTREGRHVTHSLTQLGQDLLDGHVA